MPAILNELFRECAEVSIDRMKDEGGGTDFSLWSGSVKNTDSSLCHLIPHSSKLYPLLGADACVEWMFYFTHLRHQVGSFNQFGWRIASGDNYV